MIEFLHTYNPTAVAFSLGPLLFYWYGLIATFGLIISWIVISSISKKSGITKDIFNLYFGIVVSALIGSRLYHVLNELEFYVSNPELILQIWNGGLAFHGGLLGGIIFSFFWIKKHNLSFFRIADIVAPGIILFQAIGRWGNYFNQELFGKPTNISWGIPIESFNRPLIYQDFQYFHPTFLYESILNLIIFIVLIILHIQLSRGTMRLREGTIFLLYIVMYSIVRFVLEFIRIDDTPEIVGIRLPQIVSLLLFFAVILFYYKFFKNETSNISS